MKSILESTYVEPNRPISINEIENLRKTFYKNYNISSTIAKHKNCNHFYFVKKKGKKETEILEKNSYGNCSVCWKLYKTPKKLKDKAYYMVDFYCKTFCNMDSTSNLNYDQFDLEKTFYMWLYYDN